MSRQRYVIIGTIAMAVITALALSHGLKWVWVQFELDDPYLLGVRELSATTLLSYGIALVAATFVLRHKPTYVLANEVVDELAKVTWPSREETGNATVVVIVTVLICAAYLGAFDAVWLAVTDWILGIEAAPQG